MTALLCFLPCIDKEIRLVHVKNPFGKEVNDIKVQSISKFIFNKAEYLLEDGSGSILLKIDYFNNQFEIEQQTAAIETTLINEAKEIAQDLLSRKHGVNFAER